MGLKKMLKTNLTTLLVICGLLVSLNANVIEYHPLKPVDTNIEGWNNWTWASDAELLNFFLAVLPQDTDISVRSYRLVSQQTQQACNQKLPDYSHCKSFTSAGVCQCHDLLSSDANVTDGSGTCSVFNHSLRNCANCTSCKPGYYVSTEAQTDGTNKDVCLGGSG